MNAEDKAFVADAKRLSAYLSEIEPDMMIRAGAIAANTTRLVALVEALDVQSPDQRELRRQVVIDDAMVERGLKAALQTVHDESYAALKEIVRTAIEAALRGDA
jgi:restriction endonuclease